MKERIQLTITYANGNKIMELVNYLHYEDGAICYTQDKQVQPSEIVSIPMENIASLDVEQVTCAGWKTIKEAREAKGITRAELARWLGIPKRTLENWDTGVNEPPEWAKRLIIEKIEKGRD